MGERESGGIKNNLETDVIECTREREREIYSLESGGNYWREILIRDREQL